MVMFKAKEAVALSVVVRARNPACSARSGSNRDGRALPSPAEAPSASIRADTLTALLSTSVEACDARAGPSER